MTAAAPTSSFRSGGDKNDDKHGGDVVNYYTADTFPGESFFSFARRENVVASQRYEQRLHPSSSSPYPRLPDYPSERSSLTAQLVVAAVVWFLVVPILGSYLIMASERKQKQTPNGSKERDGNPERKKIDQSLTSATTTASAERSVTGFVLVGSLVTFAFLLGKRSPNNAWTSRGVFVAPFLTRDECRQLLDMAHGAASRNYDNAASAERFLGGKTGGGNEGAGVVTELQLDNATIQAMKSYPRGWQKKRHGQYPTTDLNLVSDPFTTDDRRWLRGKFDRRIAPLLSRIYGIPPAAIRANDMFIVRYDSDGRTSLNNHTDDSDITINVLLNDEFEGGGTRYWNRALQQPFGHVKPKRPGTVATNSARINHEGAPITNGTRYLLVGFLSLDRIDPFPPHAPTNCSWYATWLNWSWMTTKFKQGYWGELFRNDRKGETPLCHVYKILWQALETLGDVLSTHHVQYLVDDDDADEYLRALDGAYGEDDSVVENTNSNVKNNKATWFRGQYLSVDIDGSIAEEWEWRRQHRQHFKDLV